MIKALIVEDESYNRKGLISLIQQLDQEIMILGECDSVEQAVIVANSTKPDLVFLDINIIGGTGFDFLEKTKALSFQVIFITAYEEHALKALKNGAVDYILKPASLDELESAIQKAMDSKILQEQLVVAKDHFNQKKERLVLKLQEGLQIIPFNDLKYCKADGGYTHFFLNDDRSFIASKSIKEFENQLPTDIFFRTHQSYIVNINFVDKYDKRGFVFLKSGEQIYVATRKKDEFLKMLLK